MVYCGSWFPLFIFPVLNMNLTRILLDSGAHPATYSVEKWTVDKGQGREIHVRNMWRKIFTVPHAFMTWTRQLYLYFHPSCERFKRWTLIAVYFTRVLLPEPFFLNIPILVIVKTDYTSTEERKLRNCNGNPSSVGLQWQRIVNSYHLMKGYETTEIWTHHFITFDNTCEWWVSRPGHSTLGTYGTNGHAVTQLVEALRHKLEGRYAALSLEFSLRPH